MLEHRLDATWLNLNRINRPRIWAAVYVLTILCFALLYRVHIEGFFHSTAKYEASTAQQYKRIEDSLTQALFAQQRANTPDGLLSGGRLRLSDEWDMLVGGTRIEDLEADQDQLTFTVRSTSVSSDNVTSIQNWFYLAMAMKADAPRLSTSPDGTERITRLTQVERQPVDLGPAHIYDIYPPIGAGSDDPTLAYIDLSPALDQSLVAFHSAVNGRPAGIPGGFLRMLYLSAGTITTLGIGDIVPIRSVTRSLVAAESVTGLVLAGLFINSVFRNPNVATGKTIGPRIDAKPRKVPKT